MPGRGGGPHNEGARDSGQDHRLYPGGGEGEVEGDDSNFTSLVATITRSPSPFKYQEHVPSGTARVKSDQRKPLEVQTWLG